MEEKYCYDIEMINGLRVSIYANLTIPQLYQFAVQNNGFLVFDEFLINMDDLSSIFPVGQPKEEEED